MFTEGEYTQDQIRGMGLNFDEITSAQNINGQAYKLDNTGRGTRYLKPVTLVGHGQGSGGFTTYQSPSVTGFNQPQAPNFVDTYKTFYESSVRPLEEKLSGYERDFITATGNINDNPFLSEATRVGRVAKMDDLYQKRTANLRGDIQTKKADIETQLNLQSRQFDINSQQAQLALQQFNTLLGAGAFDNISPSDVAAITKSTGLSSSMIQSAIQASKDAKKKDIPTQMIEFDDGTNVGFTLVNSQTGEIINKQIVGTSKPTSTGSGKASAADQKSYYINSLKSDAQAGLTLSQIFSLYSGLIDPDTIYQLYNANSKYGPDSGKNVKALTALGVTKF